MGKGKIVIWFLCLSLVIYFLFINPRTHQEFSGDRLIVRLAIWGGLAERGAWAAMEKAFEEEYPEYDLQVEMVPLKYEEKMLRRLAANTAPDILTLNIADFATKDVLLDLNPFIAADTTASYEGYLPGIDKVGMYRGKRYGYGGNVSTQILYYNTDHFKEAGIPTPNELYERGEWNWATFRETAKKLTKKDEKGVTVRYGFQFYPPVWNYIHMFGGKPFNEDFSECYLTEPNTVKAFQALADLILVDGSAPPIQYEKQLGIGWQAFYNGKVSMFISGPYMINRLTKDKPYFDVAPPPLEPGGRVAEVSGSRATGIWAGSKHPEVAWKVIRFLESRDAKKIWSGLGFDLPGLTDLANHPEEWIDTTITPEHFHMFFEMYDKVHTENGSGLVPTIPRKLESELSGHVWEMIKTGKKTAQEALEEFQPKAQAILDRGY